MLAALSAAPPAFAAETYPCHPDVVVGDHARCDVFEPLLASIGKRSAR